MGVYSNCSIGLFFMRYFGNFNFNMWYCSIIQLCGMLSFIILADSIRLNKIVHGITVPFIYAFLSIQYAKQNTVGHKGQ